MLRRRQGRITVDQNVYSAVVCRVLEEFQRSPSLDYTRLSSEVTKDIASAFSAHHSGVSRLLREASERINEFFMAARSYFEVVMLFELEAVTRVVVHTRAPYMPLEIGVSWHPFLNLPYIPSTTVKGCLRAYAEATGAQVCGLSVTKLFGTTESEGLLVVSDALPVSCRNGLIEVEVLTPHYSEPRGVIDETSAKPIPLVYPTIAPGTKFLLVLAVRRSKELENVNCMCLVKELPKLLEKSIARGMGAKTSLGYGLFKVRLLNMHIRRARQT